MNCEMVRRHLCGNPTSTEEKNRDTELKVKQHLALCPLCLELSRSINQRFAQIVFDLIGRVVEKRKIKNTN